MKNIILACLIMISFSCQKKDSKTQTAEISCGQCHFGLTSQKGCSLAIKINDKAYFVDGANIDDFGDAHDKTSGFCEVIRKAEVTGQLVGDRFKVSSVNLLD